MEQNSEANGGSRSGVATYVVEAAVAFIVLVIGIVVVFSSQQLGAGWTTDGPGAGYFPFYVGLVISISSAGILYQALFGKNKNTEVFVDKEQVKRVMSVLVPVAIYILSVQLVGLYVASVVFISLFMVILGKFSWVKSLVISLSLITLFFFMFEVWFKVPLFKGKFHLLSFLGY